MRHRGLNGESETLESAGAEHTTGVGPATTRCLSEDEILALCEGNVSATELPRIDEHLDRCEACHRCLAEAMAHDDTRSASARADLHAGAFRPGTMAAQRFRILRFIKRGGMGEVYEALDTVLEIRVALKTIISTACDSPRALRKLKAEVQLARSIRHPNVCSVFDIWEHRLPDDPSVFFFTMEFIDGLSLGQVLKRTRLEVSEALRIARLLLFGLRAAHDAGIVHRDFKSDNVMLRSGSPDDAQVVVMDFGLARTLRDEAAATSDSEHFAGSVAYMAPEQVEGRRHIGPQADVFAFGVVLFEMLTGQLPFVGDSPWTTATLRLTQRAPPPSRLRPGLPARLDAFVAKCLGREPADRYADARQALACLEQMLAPPSRRAARSVAIGAAALVGVLLASGARRATTSNVSALEPAHRNPAPSAPAPHAPPPVPAPTSARIPRLSSPSAPATAPSPSAPAPASPPPGSGAPPRAEQARHPPITTVDRASPPPRNTGARSPHAHAAPRPETPPLPTQPPRASSGPDEPLPPAGASAGTSPAATDQAATTGTPDAPRSTPPEHAPGAPAILRGFE